MVTFLNIRRNNKGDAYHNTCEFEIEIYKNEYPDIFVVGIISMLTYFAHLLLKKCKDESALHYLLTKCIVTGNLNVLKNVETLLLKVHYVHSLNFVMQIILLQYLITKQEIFDIEQKHGTYLISLLTSSYKYCFNICFCA